MAYGKRPAMRSRVREHAITLLLRQLVDGRGEESVIIHGTVSRD
jgi:hypothetical protein